MTIRLAIGLLTGLVATPAVALTDAQFQQIAADAFAPLIAEYDVPGLAVGVTWKGQTFTYTTGLADSAAGTPVTVDTLFELGSLSKTLNVTLAALAEHEGKLALADPVSDTFPQLQGSAAGKVHLIDLATSQNRGLPLQVPDAVADSAELMVWLQNWKPAAGSVRSYSNISIGLLGLASAKTYGKTYPEALTQHVLQPLGLTSTFFDVPQADMPRYAFGYDRKTDAAIRVNPGVLDAEAYGLKSSTTDMLSLLQANLGDTDLPPAYQEALQTTHAGQTRTAAFVQAMIWERYPWPVTRDALLAGNAVTMVTEPQPATPLPQPDLSDKATLFSKTGSTNGFGGYLAFIPDRDFGLVVLANRNTPLPARVGASLDLIEAVLATGD